jgi:hypothetical protein
VALGYAGGSALCCVGAPLSCVSAVVLYLVTMLVEELQAKWNAGPHRSFYHQLALWDTLLPVFWGVGAAIAWWWVARSLLQAAANHIATHERIPTGRQRLIDLDLPLGGRGPVRRAQRR